MGRTLNELVGNLKDMIENLQSDAHNASGFNKHRYNNLKIEIPDASTTNTPVCKISIGISEATYNLNSAEKVNGSLGRDERYIQRWLKNSTVIMDLKEIWNNNKDSNADNPKGDD